MGDSTAIDGVAVEINANKEDVKSHFGEVAQITANGKVDKIKPNFEEIKQDSTNPMKEEMKENTGEIADENATLQIQHSEINFNEVDEKNTEQEVVQDTTKSKGENINGNNDETNRRVTTSKTEEKKSNAMEAVQESANIIIVASKENAEEIYNEADLNMFVVLDKNNDNRDIEDPKQITQARSQQSMNPAIEKLVDEGVSDAYEKTSFVVVNKAIEMAKMLFANSQLICGRKMDAHPSEYYKKRTTTAKLFSPANRERAFKNPCLYKRGKCCYDDLSEASTVTTETPEYEKCPKRCRF